jgi:hypothetical protein
VIVLMVVVAGVVALGALLRRHERSVEMERNIVCGSHQTGEVANGYQTSDCGD